MKIVKEELENRLFELPNGKKAKTGSWFGVAWFTSGLHIGRDITFYTED